MRGEARASPAMEVVTVAELLLPFESFFGQTSVRRLVDAFKHSQRLITHVVCKLRPSENDPVYENMFKLSPEASAGLADSYPSEQVAQMVALLKTTSAEEKAWEAALPAPLARLYGFMEPRLSKLSSEASTQAVAAILMVQQASSAAGADMQPALAAARGVVQHMTDIKLNALFTGLLQVLEETHSLKRVASILCTSGPFSKSPSTEREANDSLAKVGSAVELVAANVASLIATGLEECNLKAILDEARGLVDNWSNVATKRAHSEISKAQADLNRLLEDCPDPESAEKNHELHEAVRRQDQQIDEGLREGRPQVQEVHCGHEARAFRGRETSHRGERGHDRLWRTNYYALHLCDDPPKPTGARSGFGRANLAQTASRAACAGGTEDALPNENSGARFANLGDHSVRRWGRGRGADRADGK